MSRLAYQSWWHVEKASVDHDEKADAGDYYTNNVKIATNT